MKRIGMLVVLYTLGAFMGGCAGDKNETSVEDTILAVRTFEDQSGMSGEDQTEFAVLTGDFSDPEQAQLASENAIWIPASQFPLDDEMDFLTGEESALYQTSADSDDSRDRDNSRRRNRDNNRRNDGRNRDDNDRRNRNAGRVRGQGRGHDWRPSRRRNYDRWRNRHYDRPSSRRFSRLHRCGSYFSYRRGCFRPYSRHHGYYWKRRYRYQTTWRGPRRRGRKSYAHVHVGSQIYISFWF